MRKTNSIHPLMKEYLDYARYNQLKSDNTVKNYELDLATYQSFITEQNKELLNIDKKSIEQYKIYLLNDIELKNGKKGYSPSTVARHITAVRSFYEYLKEEGYTESNPLERVKAPKIPKRNPAYLTQKQATQLIQSTNNENEPLRSRDRLILLMFLTTGLRLNELANIKLSDITDNILRIIGKGDKERSIVLNNDVLVALNNYLKVRPVTESEYLFISERKSKMNNRTIQYTVDKYLQKAKLDLKGVSTHSLRHSAAVLMLEHDVDLRTIQEVLGHEKISTTEIYTHVSNKQKEQAAQKMNGLLT